MTIRLKNIFGDHISGVVWTWNGHEFEAVQAIDPVKGYWVHAPMAVPDAYHYPDGGARR